MFVNLGSTRGFLKTSMGPFFPSFPFFPSNTYLLFACLSWSTLFAGDPNFLNDTTSSTFVPRYSHLPGKLSCKTEPKVAYRTLLMRYHGIMCQIRYNSTCAFVHTSPYVLPQIYLNTIDAAFQ